MKRSFIVFLAVLFILSAAISASAKNARMIVANGDFEFYDSATMLPNSWETHSYKEEYDPDLENAYFEVVEDQDRGMVLHITVNDDDDAAVYQTVKVSASTFYRMTCYIKTKGVENGAGANIALRGLIARSEGVFGDSDWQKIELVGKTGPKQDSMVISCRIGGYSADSHGEAWFDGFTIEKIDGSDGRIVPFYSGEVTDDTETEEEGEGSGDLWIYILVALLFVAAAVVVSVLVILKKKNDNNDAPSKEGAKAKPDKAASNKTSADKNEDIYAGIRGRNFFDMSVDNALKRTDTKLHFKRKDWIFITVLTVVYGVIAIVNLGTLKFPTNAWNGYTGETVRIEFGRSVKISQIWQNSGVSHINYILETDDGDQIAMDASDRSEYGRMFRWAKLSGAASANATTGLTLTVVGGDSSRKNDPDLVMNELVIFDENGDKVACTVPDSAKALFDEQDTVPAYPSVFNGMYFDELYHGRTAFEHLNNLKAYEWTHPPLGKLFIALGILVFGMKPFGWRIVGTLFGIAMVPMMYCFGKRVLKRSELALFSTFLFTFDFMHFTQTRIATVDVYGVFFILLMTYFMFQFLSMDIGDRITDMMRELALSGIFFGIGCASKWICMYTGVGLAVMFFLKLILMWAKSYRASNVPMKYFWMKFAFIVSLFMILAGGAMIAFYILKTQGVSDGGFIIDGKLTKIKNISIVLLVFSNLTFILFGALLIVSRVKLRVNNRGTIRTQFKTIRKISLRLFVLCLWCVLFFVMIPAAIYAASYCRYYTAEWKPARQTEIYKQHRNEYASADEVELSFKDEVSVYVKGVIKNQKDMYSYHSTLKSDHKASSPWWTWLFDLRPTWFYCGGSDNPHGYIGTISAFGNPAVWTLCTFATVGMIISLFHRKRFPTEVLFILLALGSSFLPWVLVPRSTYAYHFFASVPFITLAAGYLMGYIEDVSAIKRAQKGLTSPGFVPKIKYIWMIVAGFLFVLFYPVISGMEVPYWYVHMLEWVPFHKWEYLDKDGKVIKTVRVGWRFLDYEPSPIKDWMVTQIKTNK